jgi:hypothetical protein
LERRERFPPSSIAFRAKEYVAPPRSVTVNPSELPEGPGTGGDDTAVADPKFPDVIGDVEYRMS